MGPRSGRTHHPVAAAVRVAFRSSSRQLAVEPVQTVRPPTSKYVAISTAINFPFAPFSPGTRGVQPFGYVFDRDGPQPSPVGSLRSGPKVPTRSAIPERGTLARNFAHKLFGPVKEVVWSSPAATGPRCISPETN